MSPATDTTLAPGNTPVIAEHVSVTPEQDSNYADMLPIAIVNSAMTILTFNLYIFWAKSAIRRYIWSSTWIADDYLFYSGNGHQLAIGFLIFSGLFLIVFGLPLSVVMTEVGQQVGEISEIQTPSLLLDILLIMVIPAALSLLGLLAGLLPTIDAPASVVVACTILLVIGTFYMLTVSRFLTFRYLLRHTWWRDVCGGIDGSPWRYGARLLLPELSRWLTLGWTGPWRYMRRYHVLMNAASFGAVRIRFRGSSRDLYPRFAVAWCVAVLLGALTNVATSLFAESDIAGFLIPLIAFVDLTLLVLFVAWYNERVFQILARSITIGGVEVRFTGSWQGLAKLYVTNLVMNLASFGLSFYFSRMRIARYIAASLEFEGPVDAICSPVSSPAPHKETFGEGFEVTLASSYL